MILVMDVEDLLLVGERPPEAAVVVVVAVAPGANPPDPISVRDGVRLRGLIIEGSFDPKCFFDFAGCVLCVSSVTVMEFGSSCSFFDPAVAPCLGEEVVDKEGS